MLKLFKSKTHTNRQQASLNYDLYQNARVTAYNALQELRKKGGVALAQELMNALQQIEALSGGTMAQGVHIGAGLHVIKTKNNNFKFEQRSL